MGRSHFKHGLSATRRYKSWLAARRRCTNPADKDYDHYGGRGISMCAEWANDFEAFARDMGECPVGYTLERRDVDEDYSPSNCFWLPKPMQAGNTRANVRIEWRGENLTIAQWSRKLGIGPQTIRSRYRAGRPLDEVFRASTLKPNPKPVRGLDPLALRRKATLESIEQ